jgi:hypothetical protein
LDDFEEQIKKKQEIIDKNLKEQQKKLDAEYKIREADIKDQIAKIDQYLKQTNLINADAMKLLKSNSDAFYQSLLEWNKKFGNSVQQEIIDKLKLVFGFMGALGGGSWAGPNDRQSDYDVFYTGTGQKRYRNHDTGMEISPEEWEALPMHQGGIAGGKPLIKETEIFAKLLRGELVSNDAQIMQFMRQTLPNIVTNVGGSGESSIILNVNVAGNLDRSVLPDLKEQVFKVINDVMKNRGAKRNSFSYSV